MGRARSERRGHVIRACFAFLLCMTMLCSGSTSAGVICCRGFSLHHERKAPHARSNETTSARLLVAMGARAQRKKIAQSCKVATSAAAAAAAAAALPPATSAEHAVATTSASAENASSSSSSSSSTTCKQPQQLLMYKRVATAAAASYVHIFIAGVTCAVSEAAG